MMLCLLLMLVMPAFAMAEPVPDTGQTACYDGLGAVDTTVSLCTDTTTGERVVCERTFSVIKEISGKATTFTKFYADYDGKGIKQIFYFGYRRCFGDDGVEDTCDAIQCYNDAKRTTSITCPTTGCYTSTKGDVTITCPGIGIAQPVDDEATIRNKRGTGNEDLYGQDGNYLINPKSYTKVTESGANMIKDNSTGLLWLVKVVAAGTPNHADNTYTWASAGGSSGTDFIAGVKFLKLGGYDDWRLPTISELTYIADSSKSGPAIDATGYFSNMKTGGYWSATVGTGTETLGAEAFYLDFTDGSVKRAAKTDTKYVIAVRKP